MAMVAVSWAQDKATVGIEKSSYKPGDTINLKVKFNEPLSKDEHFDLKIRPASISGEISLGQGKMVDAKTYQISYKLPEDAIPGEWRIARIVLTLSGSWTQIVTNELSFEVKIT
jgi:hypothetical protein